MITNKKNIRRAVLAILIMGGIAVYFKMDSSDHSLSQERLSVLRAEYPVLYGTPATIDTIEVSFSQMLDFAQTAIVGEVIEKLPAYTLNLITDETAPEAILNKKHEALGFSFSEANFIPFKVKVDELIAGEPVPEYVNVYYNSEFIGYEPDLAPGTTIVAALFRAPAHPEGYYSFSKYGTYYVVDDDYVLSAYESKEEGELGFAGKAMNGKTLAVLKEEIKTFKK